jgi:hypothetical protein
MLKPQFLTVCLLAAGFWMGQGARVEAQPAAMIVDRGVSNNFQVSITPPEYGRERGLIGQWDAHPTAGDTFNPAGGFETDRLAYRTTTAHTGMPVEVDDQPMDANKDWVAQFDYRWQNANVPGNPPGPHDFIGSDYVNSGGADTCCGIGISGPHATGVANQFQVKQVSSNQNIAVFSLVEEQLVAFTLHYKAADQTMDIWTNDVKIVDGYALGEAKGLKQLTFGSGSQYNAHHRVDNLIIGELFVEAAQPVDFTSIAVADTNVVMEFVSENGTQYQLESNTDLNIDTNWIATGSSFTGNGSTQQVNDAVGGDAAKSYRIVEGQ